jgi:hypothetical protein
MPLLNGAWLDGRRLCYNEAAPTALSEIRYPRDILIGICVKSENRPASGNSALSTKAASPATFSAMSITAVIEKGIIKLPGEVPWASGTVVRIEPVDEQTPTLLDMLKDFDGMAGDLPVDLAANLDHYVHGHSKS